MDHNNNSNNNGIHHNSGFVPHALQLDLAAGTTTTALTANDNVTEDEPPSLSSSSSALLTSETNHHTSLNNLEHAQAVLRSATFEVSSINLDKTTTTNVITTNKKPKQQKDRRVRSSAKKYGEDSITAFYYGGADWPDKHIAHDIDNKILSQHLEKGKGSYVVLLTHHGKVTSYEVVNGNHIVRKDEHTLMPDSTMASAEAYHWFLTERVKDLSRLHSVFLSCHAEGFELQMGPTDEEHDMLWIHDVASVMNRLKVRVENIMFDACSCANLDVAYALRKATNNIVGFETYCPWEGLITHESMIRPDPIRLAKACLERYSQREMLPDEQPCDVSVISTRHIGRLYRSIWNEVLGETPDRPLPFDLKTDVFNDVRANPEFPYLEETTDFLYDVHEMLTRVRVLCKSSSDATIRRRAIVANQCLKLLHTKVIRYYGKSSNNTLMTHGLGMFQVPKGEDGQPCVAPRTLFTPRQQQQMSQALSSKLMVRTALMRR
eukprot:PhM_4_TR10591/c1_g1_i1/m.67619